VLASFFLSDATALKAMHKAGRRGGDSIAREGCKHVCGGCASATEAGAAVAGKSQGGETGKARTMRLSARAFWLKSRRRHLYIKTVLC